VRRFGAEFRRDESYVSALSLMAPVFELPLSDVTIVDGEKAVLECRVAVTPAAEVTWYVENVEIRQTNVCQIVFTADGWCRLIIRDDMLKDEAEFTVRAVNEAGTCISTAYLTVLPATAGERTANELIEQESTGLGERCKLPQWGAPADKGFCAYLGQNEQLWWQQFLWIFIGINLIFWCFVSNL